MSEVKVDECISENSREHSNNLNELQFTGNWFIDAGILGFVNLMEEVMGGIWRNCRKRLKITQKLYITGTSLSDTFVM